MGPRFESVKVHHGPMVKWLRQRPLTPLTWVRIPLGSPKKALTGTQEIVVDATVLAAETVIVGNVPSTYIGLGGPEEEGT